MISDGIETCDKEPCAVTYTLRKSDIHFKIHVVGFGIYSKMAQQSPCIAEAGGGHYFSADNAIEAYPVVNSVKRSVIERLRFHPGHAGFDKVVA